MLPEDERIELSRVVLRQAELRLEATLRLALAADQRAMWLIGLLTGFTSALLAGAAATAHSPSYDLWLTVGLATAAMPTLIGAIVAMRTVRPARFHVPGNLPSNWWKDGVREKPLATALDKEAANYEGMIKENDIDLKNNADRIRTAMWLGLLAPVLGVLAAAAVSICP